MSPGWTVEDQDALSRFISYLVAALSAEVYIGVQSLHTSSVGSVQVGESDFEFDLAVFLLWVLLFQSIQYGDVRVVGQCQGLFVAPYHHLARRHGDQGRNVAEDVLALPPPALGRCSLLAAAEYDPAYGEIVLRDAAHVHGLEHCARGDGEGGAEEGGGGRF